MDTANMFSGLFKLTFVEMVARFPDVYVGGKAKGRGRGYRGNKTAVVTIVQRGGNAHSHVMLEDGVNSATVGEMLKAHVAPTAVLNTDESPVYTAPGKDFRHHDTVNHKADEYVRHGARRYAPHRRPPAHALQGQGR